MRISIVAFTETEDRAEAVRGMAADRRLRRSTVAVHDGGLEAAAMSLASSPSPDLLILETRLDGDRLLQALDALAGAVAPQTRVVILGRCNDIGLYRALLGLGVSEYLFEGVEPAQLATIAETIFASEQGDAGGRVIAVQGVRGGVGASSVATNVAVSLARDTGEDVLLVDLDIPFGTAALSLNLNPRQTIQEALAQPDRLDDMLLDRFMVKVDDHLNLLAAPGQISDTMVEPTPQALEALFPLLRRTAAHVVVDLPHHWSPWIREVLLDAAEVVLVAYPDLANLRDARNMMERLAEPRGIQAPTRLVLNREGMTRKGELSAKDFEDSLGTAPVVSIPHDAAIFASAMNNGEPVVRGAPGSAAAKSLAELARIVSGGGAAEARKASGGGFSLAGLFGGLPLTGRRA